MRITKYIQVLSIFFCSNLIAICDENRRSMLDSVLLNPENANKYCFIFIPKNGTTSLRNILKTTKLYKYLPLQSRLNTFEKLIIIRDPLYRPISIYNEVMKLRKDGDYRATLCSEFYKERHNIEKSFSLFLDEIEGNFYEPHITYQYQALTEKNLILENMDYIFLFEQLNSDIWKFCQKNSIHFSRLRENQTSKSRKDKLVDFIDQNLHIQNKIHRIWKEDFVFYEEAKKIRETTNRNYLLD